MVEETWSYYKVVETVVEIHRGLLIFEEDIGVLTIETLVRQTLNPMKT